MGGPAAEPHGDDGDHRRGRARTPDAARVPQPAGRALPRGLRRRARTPRMGQAADRRLQRQRRLRRLRRLPRAAGASRHRRRLHRDGRPLARAPLHRGHARGQGRLLREAHLPLHRGGRGGDARRRALPAHLPGRRAAPQRGQLQDGDEARAVRPPRPRPHGPRRHGDHGPQRGQPLPARTAPAAARRPLLGHVGGARADARVQLGLRDEERLARRVRLPRRPERVGFAHDRPLPARPRARTHRPHEVRADRPRGGARLLPRRREDGAPPQVQGHVRHPP